MKHRHGNRILGRNNAHRKQLLGNLTSALLKHGAITTTEAKAKELKRVFEPLVTKAKSDLTLERRRHLLKRLMHKGDLARLLEVAKTHAKRPGGYTRVTKLPLTRNDAAREARIEIL